MKILHPHPWNVSVAEAKVIQQQLRRYVVAEDRLAVIHSVAGIDVGFDGAGQQARAAVVILGWPKLEIKEQLVAVTPTPFPYVPGLLSFREIPPVLAALEKLTEMPDLLLCDGQGIAHPRRFGIATHLGVLLDMPSIGVAKKRLVGTHGPVPVERGRWVALEHEGEQVGAVLRTRVGVKPVYVSLGHRISLPTAIDFVLRCTRRFRLPETTRAAHRLASRKA
ncbi:MAG: deoxyribonuclease V [Gammaproteobacteria bacterium]